MSLDSISWPQGWTSSSSGSSTCGSGGSAPIVLQGLLEGSEPQTVAALLRYGVYSIQLATPTSLAREEPELVLKLLRLAHFLDMPLLFQSLADVLPGTWHGRRRTAPNVECKVQRMGLPCAF